MFDFYKTKEWNYILIKQKVSGRYKDFYDVHCYFYDDEKDIDNTELVISHGDMVVYHKNYKKLCDEIKENGRSIFFSDLQKLLDEKEHREAF